ncbi:CDP-alcohol phosphatidyltransferase family protein [bacterium]|nr:CDP-alcohol phosphatidyltransferase family protein [bacterium]
MANFITISRILLAFVALALLFHPTEANYWWAIVLTILVIWGDGLDGFVARKFNLTSKLGAVLDIMGDRIVENVYWIVFSALGLVPVIIPVLFITRGFVVDSLRSLALAEGYTAFGDKTMMQNPVAKFIVASPFCRFTYAVVKAFAFVLLIAGNPNAPIDPVVKANIFLAGTICAWIAVIYCVLRGLPVVFESKRFLK